MRDAMKPFLLAGIAGAGVDSRVIPLWEQHLDGGSGPRDLTAEFAQDFAKHKATNKAMDRIASEVSRRLAESPPLFPGTSNVTAIPLQTLSPEAIAELDSLATTNRMAFTQILTVPGNIAGDIGKDQTACSVGAQPSPCNDERTAFGTVFVTKGPDGSLTADISATFTVKDTVDLCPGQCGLFKEQFATLPISRFEATDISGDVPFTVTFNGPLRTVKPGEAPPVESTPIDAEVTASVLRVRAGPNTTSKVVRTLPKRTRIRVVCDTTGEDVDGNATWDKIEDGFVADRFVLRLSQQKAQSCQ